MRPSVSTITTPEQLKEAVAFYSAQDEIVIDVETVGDHRIDPRRNQVLWVGLAATGRVDIIPLGHPNGELLEIRQAILPAGMTRLAEGKKLRKTDVSRAGSKARKVFSAPPEQLPPAVVFGTLRPLLFDPSIRVIGHNIKFDMCSIAKYYSGEIPGVSLGDTLIGEFVCNDLLQHHLSLADCTKRRLGYEMEKGVGAEVEVYSYQEVARYLATDVKMTWLLWKDVSKRLSGLKLWNVFNLEMDLLKVLMEMEQTGTLVDVEAMKLLRAELEEGELNATAAAYKAAGRKFNIGSAAEKIEILFTPAGFNLTPKVLTDKTKKPSTSEDALKAYPKNPLCVALLELATIKKLTSTYVTPYLGGEVERTTAGKTKVTTRESLLVKGRAHTNFKSHGAATGRLSSSNPNLQNIPARGVYGKRIRDMFIADPGHKIIQADYAQIEPRIIAALSGDPVMRQAFLDGTDIYTALASPLGLPRPAGKLLILSMSYGVGPQKIADELGYTLKRAKEILDEFEANSSVVMGYKKQVVNQAAKRRPVPYVRTILGRRRLLPNLSSSDYGLRAQAERQAFNAKIQGSAAEVIKVAMVRAQKLIPEESKMLLTVHDELLVRAPEELADETAAALQAAMQDVKLPGLDIPLLAEVNIVDRWGEAK